MTDTVIQLTDTDQMGIWTPQVVQLLQQAQMAAGPKRLTIHFNPVKDMVKLNNIIAGKKSAEAEAETEASMTEEGSEAVAAAGTKIKSRGRGRGKRTGLTAASVAAVDSIIADSIIADARPNKTSNSDDSKPTTPLKTAYYENMMAAAQWLINVHCNGCTTADECVRSVTFDGQKTCNMKQLKHYESVMATLSTAATPSTPVSMRLHLNWQTASSHRIFRYHFNLINTGVKCNLAAGYRLNTNPNSPFFDYHINMTESPSGIMTCMSCQLVDDVVKSWYAETHAPVKSGQVETTLAEPVMTVAATSATAVCSAVCSSNPATTVCTTGNPTVICGTCGPTPVITASSSHVDTPVISTATATATTEVATSRQKRTRKH